MPGTVEVGTFYQRPKGRKTVEAARRAAASKRLLLLGFAVRLTRAAHPPRDSASAALVREWWGEAWRETRRQREEKAILLQRCPSAGNTKATPRLFSLVRISSSS